MVTIQGLRSLGIHLHSSGAEDAIVDRVDGRGGEEAGMVVVEGSEVVVGGTLDQGREMNEAVVKVARGLMLTTVVACLKTHGKICCQ